MRGSTFYRRFPAAGSPSTTDFRWPLAGLSEDPGSEEYSFMCHCFMHLFGALPSRHTAPTTQQKLN